MACTDNSTNAAQPEEPANEVGTNQAAVADGTGTGTEPTVSPEAPNQQTPAQPAEETQGPSEQTQPPDTASTNKPAEDAPMVQTGPDIYLLIGQSNMVGRGNDVDAAALSAGLDLPDPAIKQLNVKENLIYDTGNLETFLEPFTPLSPDPIVTADDPLHEPFEPTRQGKSGTFIGLGLSFAKAALADSQREVLLVPAAYGGTGFCESPQKVAWNVADTAAPPFGNNWLYLRAIERTNTAIQVSGGVLRGILWHQGESDSANATCAAAYQENLKNLATALRTNIMPDDLGSAYRGPDAMIPFIVGTMSRGADDRGDFSKFDANKSLVDGAHRTVSNFIVHAGFVNNDDLVPPEFPCGEGSCLHFGSVALREIGHRYYTELRRIRERP